MRGVLGSRVSWTRGAVCMCDVLGALCACVHVCMCACVLVCMCDVFGRCLVRIHCLG